MGMYQCSIAVTTRRVNPRRWVLRMHIKSAPHGEHRFVRFWKIICVGHGSFQLICSTSILDEFAPMFSFIQHSQSATSRSTYVMEAGTSIIPICKTISVGHSYFELVCLTSILNELSYFCISFNPCEKLLCEIKADLKKYKGEADLKNFGKFFLFWILF